MKIKVIDLLNKIANGEEAPKKIKHWKEEYERDESGFIKYESKTERNLCLDLVQCLNDEVEIIEEDKKIEELKITRNELDNQFFLKVGEHHNTMRNIDLTLANKINELIVEINKLKENK